MRPPRRVVNRHSKYKILITPQHTPKLHTEYLPKFYSTAIVYDEFKTAADPQVALRKWLDGELVNFYQLVEKYDGDTLIGFCVVLKGENPSLHVLWLFVEESYRGRGHGQHLMDNVFCMAKQDQIPYITLGAHQSNTRAQAFYERLNPTSIVPRPEHGPDVLYIWELSPSVSGRAKKFAEAVLELFKRK